MLGRTHVLPETFLDLPRSLATSLLEVSGTLYFCCIWLLDYVGLFMLFCLIVYFYLFPHFNSSIFRIS